MASTREPLILASASATRAGLLAGAGIEAAIQPADIDEAAIKQAFRARDMPALDCALALAEAKARAVSQTRPGALVIGADQMLVCDGVWFDKAETAAGLEAQLLALRGRTHVLETAACVVCNRELLWQAVNRPRLRMRTFSDDFLAAYLAAEGTALRGSLGGYRLEARGVQLFDRIDADFFAVLGLPLVELLDFLRERGVLPT